MSEAEIQEKKKKLSDACSKLEHLKEEVIAELQTGFANLPGEKGQ